MKDNRHPSKKKEKLKCPICNSEFIPESFHIEKAHFDTVDTKGELMSFQNEEHQLHVKPFTSFKGAWITYCPECGYLIRFATEIGKKEVTEEHMRLLKRGSFEEHGELHKYIYNIQEKPFMDYSDYFIEKVDNIKNNIKKALDEINFDHWGQPYKDWKKDKTVDTFKFLIRFYTNLKDYTNSQVEDPNNKDIKQKIEELNLPVMLEDLLGDILDLQNKISHDSYELGADEDELIEKAFIQFIYHLVMKQLKPLNLNTIEIETEYKFIDLNEVYYELREFLHVYLFSTLYIKDFDDNFFFPLLKMLEFPENLTISSKK